METAWTVPERGYARPWTLLVYLPVDDVVAPASSKQISRSGKVGLPTETPAMPMYMITMVVRPTHQDRHCHENFAM